MSQYSIDLAAAFELVPRGAFLTYPELSGIDGPARIGTEGQQLNMKPSYAVEAILDLALRPTDTVLQIGAGTAFYTCVLSHTVPDGRIYATEVDDDLLTIAQGNAQRYGAGNIKIVRADPERIGYEEAAPYDAIFVCGSVKKIQAVKLAGQMRAGTGRMIAPVDIESQETLDMVYPGISLRSAARLRFERGEQGFRFNGGKVDWFTPLT